MYVSRFCFHSIPGKTDAVEQELKRLANMVARVGGKNIRIQRTHFASLGSPDVVFEQEAENLQDLENQIQKVTRSTDFQRSTKRMSRLLWQSPKGEFYIWQQELALRITLRRKSSSSLRLKKSGTGVAH
jgi:aminoglycoside phosphotransferase family enzyme